MNLLSGKEAAGSSSPRSFYFAALLICSVVAALFVTPSAQGAIDTCEEDGGTAICVSPEIGPYRYQVSNGGNLVAQGTVEADTIATFTELVRQAYQPCAFNFADNRPPLPPVPAGHGGQNEGDYTQAMRGVGQYWTMWWTLSAESGYQRIPLVYSGTYPSTGSAACSRSFGPFGAYVNRIRAVVCPKGYGPNSATPPTSAYCYRSSANLDPPKNFGPQQCLGNPVNPGTGNKFQPETDYVGLGVMPLRFVRYYNSGLLTAASIPTGSQLYWSKIGYNWRSNYDRAIRFSDSVRFPTAYAYRPEGQRLFFKLVNGQFIPDGDISDRLVRLVDADGDFIGWRYVVAATQEIETYDDSGKLITVADRAGVTQTLVYDSDGRLVTVTDAFGRSLNFSYDANGRIATLTDPDGKNYIYGYTATGNVSSVTYPDGRIRTYIYGESANTSGSNRPFKLTGIIGEDNSRFSTYKYDGAERVISTEHDAGVEKYTFAYSNGGTVVVDPLGMSRTYSFTPLHGVAKNTAISQPCSSGCGGGAAAAKTYDTSGNVATRTDFKGRQTTYSYDLARNLETSRTEAYGTPRARTITTQWHPTYRLPTQLDEPGRRTTYTHDASGNVLTRTELDTATSISRTWAYTYNSYGQVLTADGPRTDVSDLTTYTYYTCTAGYQCGQMHTITNAAGHITTYDTYNAHGQPLTMTDPNGVVTALTYDLRQRLTSRTVGTEVATFEYWPTGLLKKATLPDASYLEYIYDAAHRLTEINDSEGNRIVYTLDAMGNRTAEKVFDPSNALTQTRTRVFDTLSRLSQEISAAGTANVTTTFGYDNNGNQTSIAAPLGRNASQDYDELNRLTQVTDPLSGVTQYGYNALDQLISVTDPGSKVTSYAYNALGDLTQQISPDTGTTTHTYDSAGNPLTSTDARNKTATYAYDALNRVTSLSYPDQTISYTYDGGSNQKGRLTQVTDASGSTSWSYDSQGRVLSRQQSMGIIRSVGYAYDAYGRMQTLTLPSGNAVTYGYTDGKVTSLALNGSITVLSNVLYQPFGPTRGWTWGNGTQAIREYDTDGLITDIDSAGLKVYDYDDAFRITGITDASDATLSQSYGYDLLDRLTAATGTSLNQSWTYDANGNRLTQGGSEASTYTVSGTSNRLTAVSGALTRSYAYDNAGNTIDDGTATFAYNDAGRMVSATKAGTTTTYAINALGQRVRKTTGGASHYFVYDESGHLLGEYTSTGTLLQETVWFGDTPVATIRPDGGGVSVFYVHTDHLNTPRRITRPSDSVIVWRWDGDPFGTAVANEDPDGDSALVAYNLRFPGQYYDDETELNYNYYRDGYDPATGRYTQSDPIGLAGGLNTYAYAFGDPLSIVDPLGLRGNVEDFLQTCTRTTISVATRVAGGAGLFFTPRQISQCQDLNPRPECPNDCARIEAEIGELALELRLRYLAAQGDRNRRNLYDQARTTPISRRGGSWAGHRQQFMEKQGRLQRLIAEGDTKGCRISQDDRLLSTAPYPDRPLD